MMRTATLTPADIHVAAEALRGEVKRTPVLTSDSLDRLTGYRCFLKAEHLQQTGAFKERGALVALKAYQSRKAVTASAGNHGQGLAIAGRRRGCAVIVFIPEGTPAIKRERIERLGAEIRVMGQDFDEAYAMARQFAKKEGLTFIPPYDDPLVIAGQGTVALELLEQQPELDAVVVPCGGGGLTAGTVISLGERSRTKVIAVEPACVPSLSAALAAGRPVRLPPARSLAEGISVREIGGLTFEIVRDCVDEVVTVSEEEIAGAISFLALEMKQVVEGAGAATIAAVLKRPSCLRGCRNVGLLVTGGNIDGRKLAEILQMKAAS